jgi:hypothetical protein
MAGFWAIKSSWSKSTPFPAFLKAKANMLSPFIRKTAFIKSPAGEQVKSKLWAETIAEMKTLVDLPVEYE